MIIYKIVKNGGKYFTLLGNFFGAKIPRELGKTMEIFHSKHCIDGL